MMFLAILMAMSMMAQQHNLQRVPQYDCQILHSPTEGRYVCHIGGRLVKLRAEKIKVKVDSQ